jgi:hypothetical protein
LKNVQFKDYVATKNASLLLNNAMKLAEVKFSIIKKVRMEIEMQTFLSV